MDPEDPQPIGDGPPCGGGRRPAPLASPLEEIRDDGAQRGFGALGERGREGVVVAAVAAAEGGALDPDRSGSERRREEGAGGGAGGEGAGGLGDARAVLPGEGDGGSGGVEAGSGVSGGGGALRFAPPGPQLLVGRRFGVEVGAGGG